MKRSHPQTCKSWDNARSNPQKDSESSYKGVCCLLMGNTCFFVQRNPLLLFWMYSRYWNKMTKEALWLLPDGPQSLALQVERGSVWSWVPNHHAYSDHQHSLFHHSAVSILLNPQTLSKLWATWWDAVQTQCKHSPEAQWEATCVFLQRKEVRTNWTLNVYLT